MNKSNRHRPKFSEPQELSKLGDFRSPGRTFAALCLLATVAGICGAIETDPTERTTSDRDVAQLRESLTFNKDIAPILFDHCSTCHRPGQSAPFPLLTYQEVRKHAKDIVDVTARRYMPPWLPEPGYGDFVGARVLSTGQIGIIRQWVAEGAREGQPSDLPPLPKWSENWQLGEPGLVVAMPQPYTLPAEGGDNYRNFIIPIPLTARQYVKAVEFRPGTPRIVHHAFIRFDPTRESRRWDARDPEPGFSGLHMPPTAQSPAAQFLSWQPGRRVSEAPNGLSWLLETNTDLVLQLHLQPTGKPEQIQPSVGFYFTDQPPTNTPLKIGLLSYDLDIPAGAANFVLSNSYVLPADAQLLGILPHTHYLGKELRSYAILPDGTRQWLLLIKQWDFKWQSDYRYAKPVFLPKGTKIEMEFAYDNSTNNIHNPHQPPQRVRYGLQSTDEMGELWLQILARNTNDLQTISRDHAQRLLRDGIGYNEYLLRINPRDAAAQTELGRLKLLGRQYADAAKHFRAALNLKPDSDDAHYYLGLLARRQDNLSEARAQFENALRLNPDNYKAHGNLGIIFAEQGKAELAESHFRSALRINPSDSLAQECLTELLKAKSQSPGKK